MNSPGKTAYFVTLLGYICREDISLGCANSRHSKTIP